ncbi:MAG TPA: ATP synthase subunit I [Candidatus Sulfotelmatobacter sp.]
MNLFSFLMRFCFVTTTPDLPHQAGAQVGLQTERRIAWLTLVLGFGSAAGAALTGSRPWAVGLAVGTALAWLNFRWLRRGLDALVEASTAQAGAAKPQVPLISYFAAACRYGLIALVTYAIFEFLKVPLLSVILGLCALGAATIAASVYEIMHPVE